MDRWSPQKRALLPLSRIEQALAVRDPWDITRLEVDSPPETQALVDAINRVMARFADRMTKLNSFVAVAAHQIRTPLAALAAQMELLEIPKPELEQKARINKMRDLVDKLGRLTHQLLGHAMIVYRADTIQKTKADLEELTRVALRDGVPLSLNRDVAITFAVTEGPIMVHCDPVTLREALTNLINNAAMHGAPTTLTVKISKKQENAYVIVYDDGPGIPDNQWESALNPFTVARNDKGGAGLGLSIASEIVRSHGGQITFNRPANGGFEAILMIPIGELQGSKE